MGRHVPIALLCAGREEGWERVEALLLAAQREEGLRQSILEVVDEAHPEALRRMLDLILEHGLSRFSSVARATGVWLGFEVLRRRAAPDRGAARAAATSTSRGRPRRCRPTRWTPTSRCGRPPRPTSTPRSSRPSALLATRDAERRFAAVRLLAETKTPSATRALARALGDDDLRIAAVAVWRLAAHPRRRAARALRPARGAARAHPEEGRRARAGQLARPTLPALKREDVAALLFNHADPPQVDRVLPHAKALDTWARGRLVDALAARAR